MGGGGRGGGGFKFGGGGGGGRVDICSRALTQYHVFEHTFSSPRPGTIPSYLTPSLLELKIQVCNLEIVLRGVVCTVLHIGFRGGAATLQMAHSGRKYDIFESLNN